MSDVLLITVPGDTAPRRFTDTVTLGRADSNMVVLDHEVVSAEHATVRRTSNGWEVVDLGSTNGTFVDGVSISQKTLGPDAQLRLGTGGPLLQLAIPGLVVRGSTRKVKTEEIADRYLAPDVPEAMSTHTEMIRAAVQVRREEETQSWVTRMRRYRVALVMLVVVAVGAGGAAFFQARRVQALRTSAGAVFNTMKSLELDIRRLEAKTGPDRSIQERRARLEAQYQDLVKTLGIYSDRTPADVQLIYRTVHRLGESEATIPKGFVDEVRKYIAAWKNADLSAGLERASAQKLGPTVSEILLAHHLPPELFYVALQESKFDTKAIGPSTRFGVPKGLWQLIPPTAEAYGLRLGPLQGERRFDPSDERHDVAKSTNAAARYLADIYTTDAQASGLLVLASYNMGETRLRKLIRSLPESPADRNFWALLEKHRDAIPKETYDYVFRVVSAAVIGANPKLFGFEYAPLLPSSEPVAAGAQR